MLKFDVSDLRWQVEHENRKVKYSHARNDEVHDVEERLPTNYDVVENICKAIIAY